MNIFAHISNKDAFCVQFHHLLSSVLKEELIQRRKLFFGRVVYFGWPNQPASGIMENLNWKRLCMGNFLIVQPETSTT